MFAYFMMANLQIQLPTPHWGVQQFFTKTSMTLVPHPPYSLSVTPSNFFLFPQLKKVLKGKRFADVEEVKQKTAEALKGIKIGEFKNCF